MPVPFVDLRAQYMSIKPDVDAAMQHVVESTAFVGGDQVRAFETEFAAYCADGPGANTNGHAGAGCALSCVGCANGTDALYLALRALGVGPGDEVITVAHTFTATAEAIFLTGARPVFVDILEDTMLMDPALIEAAITPRTRAIIPVHLYGQPCEMDRIMRVARRHGLKVLEDAAQAHGARWLGRRAGCLGDAAAFSFYPGKNLGAYGDGGAVVSADDALIERIRVLADHGRLDKYTHSLPGVNSRLDGLQAAVLRVKLRHLDAWNAARARHADHYRAGLRDSGAGLPAVRAGAEPVWHLYVVRTPERERLQARLSSDGIASGVHYPLPLHLQPAYAHLGILAGALPVTERVAAKIVSLPMYAELPEEARSRVVDHVTTFSGELAVPA